jgi:biopolymer transport protein ExbB
MMSVLHHFEQGGLFMWPILAFGIAAIAIIIERYRTIFVKTKMAPADFRQKLLGYLQRGEFGSAEQYVRSLTPQGPLTRVVEVGCHLRANAAGEEELQARMDEKLSSEISGLDKRAGFLGMLGNVATLLGLLGTVSGMITSFAAVASANPADRALLLSTGISEALNATAFGLIVAIPSLVAYAIIQNKTDEMVGQLTEESSKIFHDLLFLTDKSGATVTAKATRTETAGSLSGLAPQPAGA